MFRLCALCISRETRYGRGDRGWSVVLLGRLLGYRLVEAVSGALGGFSASVLPLVLVCSSTAYSSPSQIVRAPYRLTCLAAIKRSSPLGRLVKPARATARFPPAKRWRPCISWRLPWLPPSLAEAFYCLRFALGFAVSLNRIAFGAHYLSDVLVAWGLTLVVIFLLRTLILLILKRYPCGADSSTNDGFRPRLLLAVPFNYESQARPVIAHCMWQARHSGPARLVTIRETEEPNRRRAVVRP